MTATISEKRFCACGRQLVTLRQVITGRCEYCDVEHIVRISPKAAAR